jgi:hypothetical protein
MRKRLILLVLVIGTVFSASILINTDTASAAAAECYTQRRDVSGNGPIVSSGCGRLTIQVIREELGHPPRQNNCYLVAGGTVVEGVGRNSDTCRLWRYVAEAPPGREPQEPANPRPTGGGGGSDGESPDSLQTEDIFGTTREELQTCSGAECVNNNPITKILIYAVNVLGALVGVIAVVMIVVAGIQYSSSGGNPQVTAEAKKRIINVMIALAAFIFLWAFMQWVIPGGALN